MTGSDDRHKIIVFLSTSRLFGGLAMEDLAQIAQAARLRRVRRKETVFHEGDTADRFYFVVDGRIKIVKRGRLGKEQILNMIPPGESFAEAAMFAGGRFPASAEAVTDSELIYFPRNDFTSILKKNPELPMRMLASLSRFCRHFLNLLEDLSLKSAPARVADYFLARFHNKMLRPGDSFDLGISKGELASQLGIANETLSRTLRKLKEDGLVAIKRREVKVLDPDGLKALVTGSDR
jgi:CRP-like cAMP-binding protein